MTTLFTNLFDGVAYGMLLFVLACGLAVTLGLMNFVNLRPWRLRHGRRLHLRGAGEQFRLAVLRGAAARLCRRPRRSASRWSARSTAISTARSHLDQVLFTDRPGLHVGRGGRLHPWDRRGSSSTCRRRCEGQFDLFGVGIGRYRLMIIVICGLLTVALQMVLAKTRFGSRLRAAVDDPRAASGLGINVPQVFAFTFAFGCGLAGLGGALSAGDPRPRSVFPAEVHDLLPDRGHRRRLLLHHRAVPGLAPARHRRRRRQILRAEDGPVRDLHHDDRDPDLAPERPVRPHRGALSPR